MNVVYVCILLCDLIQSRRSLTDEQRKLSLVESSNKANIFLGLIEYGLNSLLGASDLVDYISIHIRFDLERYLLNIVDIVLKASDCDSATYFPKITRAIYGYLFCLFKDKINNNTNIQLDLRQIGCYCRRSRWIFAKYSLAPEYIKSFSLPNDLVHDKPLRNSKTDFRLPRVETVSGQRSFSFRRAQVWKSSDKDLKGETSLGSFKKKLSKL